MYALAALALDNRDLRLKSTYSRGLNYKRCIDRSVWSTDFPTISDYVMGRENAEVAMAHEDEPSIVPLRRT